VFWIVIFWHLYIRFHDVISDSCCTSPNKQNYRSKILRHLTDLIFVAESKLRHRQETSYDKSGRSLSAIVFCIAKHYVKRSENWRSLLTIPTCPKSSCQNGEEIRQSRLRSIQLWNSRD
jgi:hypothetical protein